MHLSWRVRNKNALDCRCHCSFLPAAITSHYFHKPKGMGKFSKKTTTNLWLLPRDRKLMWSLRSRNESFPLCFAIGSLGKWLSVHRLLSIKQDQPRILQRHCEVISFSIWCCRSIFTYQKLTTSFCKCIQLLSLSVVPKYLWFMAC